MPDRDYQNVGLPGSVKETIWRNNDLSVQTPRELRDTTARLGELLEPSQSLLDTPAEPRRRGRTVTPNVGERGAELITSGLRKVDAQPVSSERNASASAITSSRL